MARVPRYNLERQVRAVSGVQQNISAPIDAFGGAEASALAAVGQGLGDVASRMADMREQDDILAAEKAYAEYQSQTREATIGEGGFLTQQGQNAVDGYEPFEQSLQEMENRIGDTLNNRQRELYNRQASQLRERTLTNASRHAAGERSTVLNQTMALREEQELLNGLSNWANDDAMGEDLTRLRSVVVARARGQGMTQEQINAALETSFSAYMSNAVTAAVDSGEPGRAADLMERYGDNMRPDHAATARELVREGDMRGRSQRAADDIMAQGLDEREALRLAREIEDPEVRDSVVQRVQARYVDQRRFDTQTREGAANEALAALDAGASLNDLQPSLLKALPDDFVNTMRRVEQGHPIVTDVAQYSRYAGMDNAALADVDLTEARGHLNESDYRRVEGWVRSARNGDTANRGTELSFTGQVNRAARDAKITSDEDVNLFYQEVQREVSEAGAEAGRRLTAVERQEVINNLAREIVIDGPGWFDRRSGRVFETEFEIEGVPEDYVRAVIDAFPEGTIPEETRRGLRGEVSRLGVLDEEAAAGYYNEAIAWFDENGIEPSPSRVTEIIRAMREQNQ